jgi:hypothetical protein
MASYLSAMISKNCTGFSTTQQLRYVVNGQEMGFGTRLSPISGPLGEYRHVFSDPDVGQVPAITTLTENGVPVTCIVRLKREADGVISEVETAITRDLAGATLYRNMTQPEAVWLEPVPVVQRLPREQLITQTNRHYRSMERNDP